MRCALSFDENKELMDQKVAAWGEMACDEICKDIDNLVEDEMMSEEASDHLQALMAGSIAMQLFSILDNQEK